MPQDQQSAKPSKPDVAGIAGEYDFGDTAPDRYDEPPTAGAGAGDTPAPIPPTPAPVSTTKHNARTLRLAADLGLKQDYVDATAPEVLDEVVHQLAVRRVNEDRDHARGETLLAAGDRPRDPDTGRFVAAGDGAASGRAPEPVERPGPRPEADDEYRLDLDESQYDEDLIRAVKKMATGFQKQIAELRGHVEEYRTKETARENMSRAEQIDAGFADLGESFTTLFGEGPGHGLEPHGPELALRKAVLQSLEADPPRGGTIRQAVAERASKLYGKMVGAAKGPRTIELADRERQFQNGHLARPTYRTSEEPPGEAKATRTAARIMREQGRLDDDGDTDESGFLD